MKSIVKNALLTLKIFALVMSICMFIVLESLCPLYTTVCVGFGLIVAYACLLITCDQIIKMVSDIKITEIAAEEVDNG